jgi:hypothetical protein
MEIRVRTGTGQAHRERYYDFVAAMLYRGRLEFNVSPTSVVGLVEQKIQQERTTCADR